MSGMSAEEKRMWVAVVRQAVIDIKAYWRMMAPVEVKLEGNKIVATKKTPAKKLHDEKRADQFYQHYNSARLFFFPRSPGEKAHTKMVFDWAGLHMGVYAGFVRKMEGLLRECGPDSYRLLLKKEREEEVVS